MTHTTPPAALEIDRLCAGYPRARVLHEITAAIPAGRSTAILGANGSGKSTLLGVLAGLLTPESGTVRRTATDRPALVVQQVETPPTLPVTVGQTVAMGRWAHRGPWRRLTRADREIVRECLARMDIADLAERRFDELSGGQRRRALLARALAQRSTLLLLDEPAAGLDAASRRAISTAVTEAAAAGTTVVQATHDPAEAGRAAHCLVLREGRLVAAGPPASVPGL
ncbi:zinc ABC transporter ATP-binding protein AztA [Nocardia takedensis]|uniref:zinc ABC transporter ATP-binding protein AztA n=1 Tax=Nocardia takedensis TaxID=259390 RepID=UPI00030F145B|nr:zinc ABC transporter ATP-binding protein AztA [Nocardia takedensis]